MISIYKSIENTLVEISEIVDGSWTNLTNPTDAEIREIASTIHIDIDLIKAALDEEERSRIEIDDNNKQTLIVVDVPVHEIDGASIVYETLPLGIIITPTGIVTVCLKKNLVIQSFLDNIVKTFFTFKKSRFILQVLYRNAQLYLQFLKQIDRQSNIIENKLRKTMKNEDFLQLLDIEKSLVYFSAALKANQLVLEKLLRHDFIKKYPDDKELLEDTIIENKQAIEMATIYLSILESTMDTFTSVISNNANTVMKFLTSVTIVLTIPNIFSGFYGMNVLNIPFSENPFGFYFVVLAVLLVCIISIIIMWRRKMF